MSMKPSPIDPIPEETVRIAQAAFPNGNIYMTMRDEFGAIYRDGQFAALFPERGQPAEASWRLALVTIMQFLEDLTDRQAADAVRSRLDWKYALSLPLSDAGFDYSVLSKFRTRLVEGQAEQLLFEQLLTVLQQRGLVKAGGKQRTDSTHILAAVRTLSRLELVGETLRQALEALAVVAPDWLRQQVDRKWLKRYGQPFHDGRLPKTTADKQALAKQIGRDGAQLLTAIWFTETCDEDQPRLITDVQTALAPSQDYNATPVIQQALTQRQFCCQASSLPMLLMSAAIYLSPPVKNLALIWWGR